MKKIVLALGLLVSVVFSANAQYKKDGTPDMRYNSNKQSFSRSYPSTSSSIGVSSSTRYQNGYTKSDGSYVQSHVKTNINSTNHDNLSTTTNYNIYNGTTGSRAKDYTPAANNYGSGKTISTGVNGGQYYINSNGNKTYVPKRGGY